MQPLIFDLDGTLIDSAPDIHSAANKLMDQVGHAAFEFNEIRSYIGNGVPVLVERIMAARNLPHSLHAELVAKFLENYAAEPATLTRPYPNVLQALGLLAKSGHELGICTNKPEEPTRRILASLGMAELFAATVGGDTLAIRKPSPEPLLHTIELLGHRACIYIGDSEIDAETAEKAGMPFVLFTEGYRKSAVEDIACMCTFSDFSDLPGIIDSVIATS